MHVKLVYPADLNFTFYEESGFVGIVDLTDRFDKVHTLRMLANGEVKNTIVLQGENKLEQELDRYFLNWPDITPGEYYITFDGINAQGKQIYLPVLDANNAKSTHQGYRILVERTNTKLFPPLVMMTFPLNEFLLTDQSEILLAASATDRDGVVESIKFLIDGEHYQTVEPAVVQRGNQHASVKWSPPGVGVFTISAIARDNSGNETLSTPVNVSVYSGIPPSPVTNGEKFEITLPFTEDDVIRPIVNDIEQAEAEITAVLVMGPLDELGSIRILEVTNPGAGYLEAPKVRFYGAGQGAQAVAKIGTDPFSPLFGRVTEIALTDHGKGYAPVGQFGGSSGGSRVSIEGGHLHTQVPIKISLPGDEDKYKEVYVLLNGELFDLNRDSNLSAEDSFRSKPFQTAHGFYPGDYQIHALSRDIYNNLQVSIENNVSIKTTKGLRPSAEITYPILSIESTNQTSQGDSYEAIGASSEIPIFIDAVDEDGNPEDLADLPEVNLYANNQLLGNAKRVGGNSLKYFFDLQDININAGKYMFNVGAIDYEGNYIRSKNLPIEIVTTMQVPPEIGNLVPTSALDRFSVGTEIFFTVNVRERDRPIRLVEFLADGEVVDSTNEPILSIGDLHIYSGSFTPSRSKDFLFSAVATDLSGVKAFSNAEDTEDNATEGLEELITSRYQIDNIVNGEPINGKDYTIASFVGNRKSTKLTNISVSSTFGSNLAPIASLQIPENVAYARAPEKLKLVVNAQDLDGHSSALSCQFLVNGSNEIIQFKSNPVPGDQIIFSGVDPYEFGVDIVIADDLEKTVVNLYNQLTTDIENGTLSDVYFAFMPENFYSGETDLSLANSIFLRTDSTKVEVNTGLLNSDSINVNHLPYIESSDSGTFLGEWTPTLGGLFVINAVVKDSMGGTVITNSSIMVAERVKEGEKRYKNPDFNGTLVIYPTEALNNPVARGSTLSVRADYTSMQGIPFDDYIQSVQFKYNGVAVGKEQTNGPFSVNVQLTDEEPTWRIEAFANPVNPEVLLVISAEGAVAPAVRKPSVTLLPPLALSRRSSSQYPTFPDGMELSLQMIAEGADEILRQVERGEFFFNGKSVSGNYREAIRTNAAGQYTAITYTIDVILDFDEYAKLDGDLNVSAMIHMRGMVAPTMAVISGTSDENSFMIKLDVPSPDNISAASLFMT